MRSIVWFEDITKSDIALAGGKGANLGELYRSKIPVPPGFVVTAQAYFEFMLESGLEQKIRQMLNPLDVENSEQLQDITTRIKELLRSSPMPDDIATDIKRAYRKLGGLVAVRSSATAEDLPEASFAGQQSTFLNISGEDDVVKAVQECWASLFEPRAIFYRVHHNFDHLKVGIAVPVQRMAQSDVSGVMFTLEPVSDDRTKMIIEAVYGLGEALVSGEVTPDLYLLDKDSLNILEKTANRQEWKIARDPTDKHKGNARMAVPKAEQSQQKLSDTDIIALAKLGKRIEELYQFPQDIEWAKEGDVLYIVQTRPVTTQGKVPKAYRDTKLRGKVILSGIAASPGIAWGAVRIVPDPSQISKVAKGNVLVTEMTTPDFVPAMKRAAAVVTDRGGRTAHAAIVSRELGLPCVVGTELATQILQDGMIVTVDGSTGRVYEGKVVSKAPAPPAARKPKEIKTRTKLYVNLAQPELAETIAARDVDGVGLLRAEFILAQIGEHPRFMLAQHRGGEFVDRLAQGLDTFARAFHPRPVVYRTTDFKTNEYRNLRGGEQYEKAEENPMLGYRGCSRYTKERDVLELEISAVKRVRQSYENLWVMIPFVRFPSEMKAVREILADCGLFTGNFKLWMMAEVPSNVFLIDEFMDTGIDGISIGSNDLTQLILGMDRDNDRFDDQFDERNEAVLIALRMLITATNRRGITSSICGQAPSVYPELTEKLVSWGITSVSVSPDMIDVTREIIAQAEAKLFHKIET